MTDNKIYLLALSHEETALILASLKFFGDRIPTSKDNSKKLTHRILDMVGDRYK